MLLAAFVPPVVVGFLLLRLAWPSRERSASMTGLQVCLAGGLALGVMSVAYFVWSAFAGRPGVTYLIAEGILLTLLAIVAGWGLIRQRGRAGELASTATTSPAWVRWLCIPFAVAAILATIRLWGLYLKEPHGNWDAVVMWNLRARFLFRNVGEWTAAFSPILQHTDYPLFLPASVARCWTYLGTDLSAAAAVVGAVMFALTVGTMVCGLNAIRGSGQGWLAGLVLLCTGSFVYWGGVQYADVPLSGFMLMSVVLLVLHDRNGRSERWFPALAGLTAGLAAWTKNEGLVFLAAVFAYRLVVAIRSRSVASLLGFVIGAVPVVLVLAYFKLDLAPINDLVAAQGNSTLSRVTDVARHRQIAAAFAIEMWKLGPGMLVVLAVYAMLVRGTPVSQRFTGSGGPGVLVMLMLVGYYLAYLTTPHDLTWHLDTSMDRLLVQVWPLALFALFLNVGSPFHRETPPNGPA